MMPRPARNAINTEIVASDMIILESRQGGAPSRRRGERPQLRQSAFGGGARGGSRSVPDDPGGFSDDDIPF
jgi:single-stranded DNA-binding protein